MKSLRITAVFVSAMLLSAAACAEAMPPPPAPGGQGPDGGNPSEAGPGPGERRGPGGHGPRLPQLAGIELTEVQQDRLFAILHAQAPQLREHDKQEDKARDALRTMLRAGDYDEARAAAHTKALGQAIAARELLRVRTAAQVEALLTPAQRAQRMQRDSRQ